MQLKLNVFARQQTLDHLSSMLSAGYHNPAMHFPHSKELAWPTAIPGGAAPLFNGLVTAFALGLDMASQALSYARSLLVSRHSALPRFGVRSRISLVLALALACGLLALVVILMLTGQRLSRDFAGVPVLVAILALLGTLSCWRRLHWRVGDVAWALVAVITSMLLCGLVSTTGLRLGFPLADSLLRMLDQKIGFDTERSVVFSSRQPMLTNVLYWIYNQSGTFCLIAALWNLLLGARERFWSIVVTHVCAAQTTAIVSMFFPGEGAILYLGLDALQGQGLPYGAGSYSAAEFKEFYWGSGLHVSPEDMAGIVVFPSFHTVMALIILQGFVASRLRWLALSVCALTIISTVPIGGHYVVDLIGGVIVWMGSYLIAVRACHGWQTEPVALNELVARVLAIRLGSALKRPTSRTRLALST